MDLIIMAAGLGSRFGGLKQLSTVDDENNFLIDYSIFDAVKAGFNHIIFVIKKENFEIFKSTIGKRAEKIAKVDYAFQDFKNIPKNFDISTRTKPFGTGHAVLCAKPFVSGDFAVINADDFYGYDAFLQAANFLKNKKDFSGALVAYKAKNTMSETGSVKRGICFAKNDKLECIIEAKLAPFNNHLKATPLQSKSLPFEISKETPVSMNFFAFSKSVLDFFETYFLEFLNINKKDLSVCEFFLPTVVSNLISKNNKNIKIISSNASWFGMTYREDLKVVKAKLKQLKVNNQYPIKLYS